MKRGITRTAVIVIVLGIAVILIFAVFIGQQRGKTEETVFKTIWKKFFPSATETVVIKGTVVGKGCPTIEVIDASMLAQAMIDCWCQGEGCPGVTKIDEELPCCYKIVTNKLTGSIKKDTIKKALEAKGGTGTYIATATCSDFVWKVGTVNPGDSGFKVCYDQDGCNEVSATRETSDTNCED